MLWTSIFIGEKLSIMASRTSWAKYRSGTTKTSYSIIFWKQFDAALKWSMMPIYENSALGHRKLIVSAI